MVTRYGVKCNTEETKVSREAEPRGSFVTFRVSPEERRELQLLARAEGTSRSALIRELVKDRVAVLTGEDES